MLPGFQGPTDMHGEYRVEYVVDDTWVVVVKIVPLVVLMV